MPQFLSIPRVITDGATQTLVPVVAIQRPVDHHETAGETPVGDGLFKTEGLGAGLEWCGWSSRLEGRCLALIQLPHHDPGGRLHWLKLEEGIRIEIFLKGCTGFIPSLSRFPAPSERALAQRQQITEITSVNEDGCVHPERGRGIRDVNLMDAIAVANGCPQRAVCVPLQT